MARYKVLASAAHNFGASFISVMNNAGGDFAMCHLIRAVQRSEARELRVDLLAGTAEPSDLCPSGMQESIEAYRASFGRHIQNSGAALDMVSKATLRITVRPGRVTGKPDPERLLHALLECEVVIVDDRGKVHSGHTQEAWACHPTKFFW